jgi:signal peptidase II
MERRTPDAEAAAPPAARARPHTGAPVAPLPNGFLFWPVALIVVFIDVVTKAIAAAALAPAFIPHPVIGEVARLTLVYNRGAAFGIHVGMYSRPIFAVLTVGALAILWRLYRATIGGDWRRVLALALVSAGAVGNLIDRLRSARGVVDFIDIGTATWRWPTFNVADIAVTTGAFLLAVVLWREDRAASREAAVLAAARMPVTPAPTGPTERSTADADVPVTVERGGIA